MCGIAGFIKSNQPPEEASSIIRRMTSSLVHRGPDGEGYYSDERIELGHRRLSIIDLDMGDQPMTCADGRYRIVYNGEIYNYIELRRQLESRGVRFRTRSDTEVLLQQYATHGPDGLHDVNGMFALAIWDAWEQSLFLARDRIGIKPLHYAEINQTIIFASEIKAMLRHPLVRRDINLPSIGKYFSYGYIPAPDTVYQDIRKLEPGHYLMFRKGRAEVNTYWDIPLADFSLSGNPVDECADMFMSLFREAVEKQLRSDVPVGVFLSGGIDSSLITAVAARHYGKGLASFSIGFDEAGYDESAYARLVSEQFETQHHHEVLTPGKAAALLPVIMDDLDEPFGDASVVPTRFLSSLAAGQVKVALGGDGGDELFAGYPSFMAHKVMERISVLPVSWRETLVRAARRLPVSSGYASVGYLADQFFKGAGISPEIRFMIWMGAYGNDQKRDLFTAAVQHEIHRANPFEDVVRHARKSRLAGSFERLLYVCMKMYLQDGVLVKVDRASMAHSLEVRVPYLDHHLVEFVSGLPSTHKLRGITSKYLLKKAARDILPSRIINRRKNGFMMPLADWIRGDFRPLIEDLCSPQRIRDGGLFNPDFVSSMLGQHFNGQRDHRKLIWTLLAFQCWKCGRSDAS